MRDFKKKREKKEKKNNKKKEFCGISLRLFEKKARGISCIR